MKGGHDMSTRTSDKTAQTRLRFCALLVSLLVPLSVHAAVDRPASIEASGEGAIFDVKATAAGTLRVCTKPGRAGDRWRATIAQAVRSDYEPDNRLTAVSELEQMLKSGLGDREQNLQLWRTRPQTPTRGWWNYRSRSSKSNALRPKNSEPSPESSPRLSGQRA